MIWYALVQIFLSFSYLLILAKSLKNYSKLQTNHKIENPTLLDST